MSRRRYVAAFFVVVTAPSFARCDGCGAALAGLRAWSWLEYGQRKHGRRCCCFTSAQIGGAS